MLLSKLRRIFRGFLVGADELLVKVTMYDVADEGVKFQKNVERQIDKAEEQLVKGQEYALAGRPDKAIIRFAISWLHAQLALRMSLCNLKVTKY